MAAREKVKVSALPEAAELPSGRAAYRRRCRWAGAVGAGPGRRAGVEAGRAGGQHQLAPARVACPAHACIAPCAPLPTAAQELKTASTALASELLRTRQESEREITALRDDMLELTSRFKGEQVGGGERWVLLVGGGRFCGGDRRARVQWAVGFRRALAGCEAGDRCVVSLLHQHDGAPAPEQL